MIGMVKLSALCPKGQLNARLIGCTLSGVGARSVKLLVLVGQHCLKRRLQPSVTNGHSTGIVFTGLRGV